MRKFRGEKSRRFLFPEFRRQTREKAEPRGGCPGKKKFAPTGFRLGEKMLGPPPSVPPAGNTILTPATCCSAFARVPHLGRVIRVRVLVSRAREFSVCDFSPVHPPLSHRIAIIVSNDPDVLRLNFRSGSKIGEYRSNERLNFYIQQINY